MPKKINYFARNFLDVRTELVSFIKQYYPDLFSDFNDASVGMMLLELNAAVSDNLSFHTDRMVQETQIDYAQERRSLLSLARTFGLKLPGKRPSITIVDWSVTIPVKGDTYDIEYAPIIKRGSQAIGAGKVFEIIDDIDFSSPYSSGGIPNRLIIPNIDSNGIIQNYTLTKRELVLNGTTKIHKRVLTQQDVRPFLDLILPDTNVLSIEQVITLEGTNFNRTPTQEEFLDSDNRWFEVEALAENKVFIEDSTRVSDNASIKPGKWLDVTRRFIKEFTDNGFCKLTFGAGVNDADSISEFVSGCSGQLNKIGDFINNFSLGEIPKANNTVFIKYRIGGGADTNIGPNVLTSLGIVDISVNGTDNDLNALVSRSLTVNNPIPALGGTDELSVEQLRHLIKYNFSSQNRCVTIKDYQSRIVLMPGEFGVPFRNSVAEEQNKVVVSILGLDEDSKLTNQSTNTLKTNIAEYLSDYRALNDYVTIKDGKIFNIGFEIDLFIDKTFSKSEIVSSVINSVIDYMNINNLEMGENIYLSQLLENVNNVGGVLNVVDLRVFNKVGGGLYSLNEVSQPLLDDNTRQINLLNEYTLFAEPNSMFEIKFPEKDIIVRVKG